MHGWVTWWCQHSVFPFLFFATDDEEELGSSGTIPGLSLGSSER